MIRRLLVANRGEIAVRVARAARELGIAPLGIYSEADADAYHRTFMEESRCVGAAPAAESYLAIGSILEAARAMNADAIHPGYGFLSESAAFARAVCDAGIVFVGPPVDALAAMGSKIQAKRHASAAGVPTVPGYGGDDQSPQRLRSEAEGIGLPVLIKASGGGGGRGMRVVAAFETFDEALAAAKREAKSAFGDDAVLLERYLANPRHIEFQVLADGFGTTLHLGERECSIQRRHQKIVEESPSVAVTPALRAQMGDAAVRVARAVGYVNAGTVEFMLDADGYYFLEMNARLQVEHPVTEIVYGIDLVQWQLRIAAGERLKLREEERTPRGWAVEMRVTAEDPAHAMLPSSGTIARWTPPEGPGIRIDSGVTAGSEIGLDYDSMLAKIVVHANDRDHALAKMECALDAFVVDGVQTNLPLLRWIVRDAAFRSGDISTSFLAQRLDGSQFAIVPATREAVVLAATALLLDGTVPWRIGGVGRPLPLHFPGENETLYASASAAPQTWELSGALRGTLIAERNGASVSATLDGARFSGIVTRDAAGLRLEIDGRIYALDYAYPPSRTAHADTAAGSDGAIVAPMPGRVIRVAVAPGDEVAPNQLLAVLEAMKMEHRIESSSAGTVRAVLVREGELVAGGAPLLELD